MSQHFGWIDLCPHTKLAEFGERLEKGQLVGSCCRGCGQMAFPPRADCARCLGGDFELTEVEPRGRLLTFTCISAAPAGFEDVAPYTLGVVELRGGGRLVAWMGESIPAEGIEIGMPIEVVPRVLESSRGKRILYTLEAETKS